MAGNNRDHDRFSLLSVNLSGAEYDPSGTLEGTNYTYPSDAEIDYYASKGMNAIRLPFLLERVEPVAGGPLNATELGYIDQVTAYAASKGIASSWTLTTSGLNMAL